MKSGGGKPLHFPMDRRGERNDKSYLQTPYGCDWLTPARAVEFYRKADIDLYCRHIAMCDAMRRVAEYLP